MHFCYIQLLKNKTKNYKGMLLTDILQKKTYLFTKHWLYPKIHVHCVSERKRERERLQTE